MENTCGCISGLHWVWQILRFVYWMQRLFFGTILYVNTVCHWPAKYWITDMTAGDFGPILTSFGDIDWSKIYFMNTFDYDQANNICHSPPQLGCGAPEQPKPPSQYDTAVPLIFRQPPHSRGPLTRLFFRSCLGYIVICRSLILCSALLSPIPLNMLSKSNQRDIIA